VSNRYLIIYILYSCSCSIHKEKTLILFSSTLKVQSRLPPEFVKTIDWRRSYSWRTRLPCRLFFTACKAEINHFPYSLGQIENTRHNNMLTATIKEEERTKMKNNGNNHNKENIFHFFLEYQQAKNNSPSTSTND
jgi:hypothetical protein